MTRSHCNKCSKTFPHERQSLTGSRAPYGFKPLKRQNSPLPFNHKRLWLLAFDGFIAFALGYVIVVRWAKSKDEPEEKAKPKAKMQYNFTDPESRILPGADGFVQAYNAQIAVEPDFQWIVGQRVTQAANDKQQLQPRLEAIRQQAGQTPREVMTDSGYCSEANLKYLEKKKIAGFIATDRESYRDRQQSGPRGPLPEGATRVDRMRRKLQTKLGAAIYSRRKTVVEPVFGQIKQARGFRQFLLRGLEKVQGEWAVICLTHNILKLHRLCYG